MKITPVLIVEDVETCLTFWVDRMGFGKVAEVPEGGRIGFAILARRGAELMLQSIASVRNDEPKFVPDGPVNGASLFVEVDDFGDVLKRLEGYPIEMPERTTFYGMREIGVRDPAGNIAIFAIRVG
ncbi:MAG: VOC family protein [Acidobacteriota bacterium]|nr:VOC family protein [Acidobacteriota bacterium]